jgi:hypothetical protein
MFYGLGPITIAMVLAGSSVEKPGPAMMDSSVSLAARALARSCVIMVSSGVDLPALPNTITPACGASGMPAGGPYWRPCNPGGGSRFHPASSRERLISLQISHASATSDATIPKYCRSANCFMASAMRLRCSTEMDRGALNFSNSSCALAACAFASAVSLRSCSACVVNSAIRSEPDLVSASKSFWATSATRYKMYADAAVSSNANTPSMAPQIRERIPNRSQKSIEYPHSNEWSLALFVSAMMAIIAFASITLHYGIKALRLKRRL